MLPKKKSSSTTTTINLDCENRIIQGEKQILIKDSKQINQIIVSKFNQIVQNYLQNVKLPTEYAQQQEAIFWIGDKKCLLVCKSQEP